MKCSVCRVESGPCMCKAFLAVRTSTVREIAEGLAKVGDLLDLIDPKEVEKRLWALIGGKPEQKKVQEVRREKVRLDPEPPSWRDFPSPGFEEKEKTSLTIKTGPCKRKGCFNQREPLSDLCTECLVSESTDDDGEAWHCSQCGSVICVDPDTGGPICPKCKTSPMKREG